MRCNQVSINIERFGKYVPKDYPASVQKIHVYCDDSQSVFAALSKAYAMAVNELNQYENIGVRADVSTNEFSYVDYRKMHGTIPKARRSYYEDLDLEYTDTRLSLLKDYAWVYEHSGEIVEVIKGSGKEDVVPALRERFALDEVQVRKLMQIRMDMLDRDRYEEICREIKTMEEERKGNREKVPAERSREEWAEHMCFYYRDKIRECEREMDVIKAYFTAADHYDDIIRILQDSEDEHGYTDYMKNTYGLSAEQARAIRYAPAENYSRQGRSRQEEKLRRLEEELKNYRKWMEEEKKETRMGKREVNAEIMDKVPE